MIYVIEIWNAKPAWLELSVKERTDYMGQVGNAVKDLIAKGVKILTWSVNESKTPKRADKDYFAIWTFPNQEIADGFLKMVEEAGWYNYFEQVNLMGEEASVEEVIGKLVQL